MKTAYVTTLCNGDAYAPGVEALGKSLEASGSTLPRMAMVTPDIDGACRGALERQGWQTIDVDPIRNPTSATEQLFPRFSAVFTKLRAWDLAEFDRIVLLDADTLVLQNVDDLFERRAFAAGPDFFLPDHFNSGVMVLEPSRETFLRMTDSLAATASYDGGDQGFLNTFFPDWYAMPVAHRLPVGYNMPNFIYQFLRGHPSLRAGLERDVKILHYMVQKPWHASLTLTGGSAAWWKTYYAAHPEKAGAWKEHAHTLEDWSFDRLASFVLD
jgi:lipopolysaccharide biosynthesis glycosyltransferase